MTHKGKAYVDKGVGITLPSLHKTFALSTLSTPSTPSTKSATRTNHIIFVLFGSNRLR